MSQAYRLDERINSKLRQLDMLREMSASLSQNMNDVCVQTTHSGTKLEDTVLKIMEQEEEIDSEIDALVDLRKEIRHTTAKIADIDCRLILEKRYLLFEKWEEIAVDMNISIQHVFRLHKAALQKIDVILKDESK